MAHVGMTVDDEVRGVALKLATEDGRAEGSCIAIAPGVYIPIWAAYVSQALLLLRQKRALGK